MRKNIAIICVTLAAVIAAQGCINHEIRLDSFEELCIASGGTPVSSTVCSCGYINENKETELKPCAAGVVCIDAGVNGFKCAGGSLVDQPCAEKNATTCEDIDGSGYHLVCSIQDKSLKWSKTNICQSSNEIITSCTLNSGISSCGICLNGDTQCGSDAEKGSNTEVSEAEIQTCVNGEWQSGTCETGLCKNGVCVECTDNERECIGNTIYECKYGKRFIAETCQFGCKQNEEIAECNVGCTEGNDKCENDTLYTCQNGNWTIVKGCVYEKNDNMNGVQYGEPVSCNLANNIECGKCKIGSVYCSNTEDGFGQKQICSNGTWGTPESCKYKEQEQKSCANSTSCGECKNDDTKCEENMYFVCNNGNWIPQESCGEFECSSNDKVCAECRSGDIKCENDETGKGSYRICNEYGLWEEEPIPCGEDVSCVKDLCSSASGECHAETVCGECLNNTQYCQAEMENDEEIAKQYNCVNGNLQILTCEAGICNSDNTACAECKPDSTKCENDAKLVCNSDGTWGEARTCIYEDDTAFNGVSKGDAVSCNGGNCGKCKNEDSYCEDINGKGHVTICENGNWSEFKECTTGGNCVSSDSCGECENGQEKCENNVHNVCENGNWIEKDKCEFSCTEKEGKVTCHDCKPGDVKCENKVETAELVGKYSVCNTEGSWSEETICKYDSINYTCHAEYCSGCSEIKNLKDFMCNECNAGEVQCIEDTDGAKIEACKNGKWEFSSYCNSDKCSINKTTCGECLTGDSRCKDGNIQQCENGSWSEPKSCGENVVCKTDKTCGACPTGKVQCTSDETGAKLEVCRNGQWEFSSYCESGKCKVGEENPITCEPVAQVLCFDGMTKCENGYVYTCQNYEWAKTETECDETKTCVDGTVLSCTNSYDGYGNLIVCRDGTYKTEPCYIDDDPSKPKSSCSNEKSCGECLSGWYNAFAPGVEIHDDNKCVMPTPQICINGLWKSVNRVECKPCEEPDNSTLNKDEFQSKKHPYIRCK